MTHLKLTLTDEDDVTWTCIHCESEYTDADFRASGFLCLKCGFTLLGALEELGVVETCLAEELWSAGIDFFRGTETEIDDERFDELTDQASVVEHEIIRTKVLPADFRKFLVARGWLFEFYDERTWAWVRIDRCGLQFWEQKHTELARRLLKEHDA